MKSFFNCLILCGLVVLVGCSGGSPKPPTVNPPPGGGGDGVWAITSLQADNGNPLVNTRVTVTATVTLDGDPAPDGTSVRFLVNGGQLTTGSVLTTGGQAQVGFTATEPGIYSVQAQVNTVSSTIQVVFKTPDTSDSLQIWSINPSEGSYAGGETVTLTGKGIAAPAEVYFTVQGVQYQAIVDQVVPSVPASSAGTITIRTPEPTAADATTTSPADIRVVVAAGSNDEQSQTYPSAFTYISDTVIVGDPTIFGVEPYWGRSSGGELVTILGLNFGVEQTKELVRAFDEVYFTFQGQDLIANVERWSATQIEVTTPRFSLTPLSADENAGIKLTLIGGGTPVVKDNVFIVRSDVAQPVITGISPTAGPLDGGTVVTITGGGFELPLQVLFGTYEATGVQLIDDQTPADNDVITCQTPDLSQQGITPPYPVNIEVRNLQTGLSATSTSTFTFGDILYVTQADPTEGQIGDQLSLYGAGFEDPLTVWFSGNIEFDVLSVTGTELSLRSPTSLAPTCADRTGGFTVVLNETGASATGATYTLIGNNPTVTSVDPIFIDEIGGGAGTDPSEIDIYGVRFAADVLVTINGFTVDTNTVTVVSPQHIHVNDIPTPNDFGRDSFFSTNPCITGTGLAGTQEAPTTVNVTVENLPLSCNDTLNAALVYQPQTQTCVEVPPQISTNPAGGDLLAFPDTTSDPGGASCSGALSVTISNIGPNPLTLAGVSLASGADFIITNPPVNVILDAGQLYDLQVDFCPTAAGNLTDTLSINHNATNEPNPILIDLGGVGL